MELQQLKRKSHFRISLPSHPLVKTPPSILRLPKILRVGKRFHLNLINIKQSSPQKPDLISAKSNRRRRKRMNSPHFGNLPLPKRSTKSTMPLISIPRTWPVAALLLVRLISKMVSLNSNASELLAVAEGRKRVLLIPSREFGTQAVEGTFLSEVYSLIF